MQKQEFFAYQWHIDDNEPEITSIRVYGLTADRKNVCLRIDNFTPYVYLELPTNYNWDHGYAQLIGNKIDEMLGDKRPVQKALMYRAKLYGAHLNKDFTRKEFPYLFCSFSSRGDIKTLGYKLKQPLNVPGLGAIRLKIHESDADPILQLVCCRNIPTAGWIKFSGKLVEKGSQLTLCDYEYCCGYKTLYPIDSDVLPSPKVMGFDIEVNSTNPNTMPNTDRPGDKVFQISCVTGYLDQPIEQYKEYIITLGDPDQESTGKNVKIVRCETEADVLTGFTEMVRQENPNILVGYNIMGFDFPYMVARAKSNLCIFTFDQLGFHKYAHAKERQIKWSSSAYKNQEFSFLDAEGRLVVDLLPLIRRDFTKMNTYTLKNICSQFLGETKDPLTAKGIFKCYRIGTKKNEDGGYSKMARKALGIVSKYCVQDARLVIMLMLKLGTWPALTEMAKVCNTPIFALYTAGQQIKVFSQIYKYCFNQGIVVEKDAYLVREDERYVGAHVFPPIPGAYNSVVPFDFASLYPSIMIAYNVDYHTWVKDDSDIPDSMCNVYSWQDCQGCPHDPKVVRMNDISKLMEKEQKKLKDLRDKRNKTKDKEEKAKLAQQVKDLMLELKPYTKERSDIKKTLPKHSMCAKRYYRTLKEPLGVLPTVVKGFLDARAAVRGKQKVLAKQIDELKKKNDGDYSKEIRELNILYDILEKRQLAYKVSANSAYGAMGVRKGYLPFMIGAMIVTYMGRVNINKVAKTIPEKFGGHLVYGDTDSNYVNFPHLKTAKEIWDHAVMVAKKVSEMFPPPMKIEFENVIYSFFMILTKKRYMYRSCGEDGIINKKIGKKGVLLARRDNSKFVRDVYEAVIGMIADGCTKDEVLYYVLTELNLLCSHSKPLSDFVITKAVGDIGDVTPVPFTNEKGKLKAKIGDYTVPILDADPDTRADQMKKKGADTEEEYYLLCLPAQVQLAERMRRRGQRVDPGTRLEYVVSLPGRHTAKQYEKVESAEYMLKYGYILGIDYLYYIHALATPLDQVLTVIYHEEFVMKQYKFRSTIRKKVIDELNELFSAKFIMKK